MHVRVDYASSKYSNNPEDKPARLAEYLQKAGHSVDVTEDRHPKLARGGLDLDAVVLTVGSASSALLKLLADSREFFQVYLELGRADLGIRGASALVRLGDPDRQIKQSTR
jgi:hypothetical protein